jgi:antitoxin component YwqK of YwqJK toxin-antitoxin module
MKSTFLLCIAFVMSLSTMFAQTLNEKNLLINSGELLDKGLKAHDAGEYKEAISYYNQITRNDTNYVTALEELGLSYAADSQFTESIRVSLEALKDPRGQEFNIYNNLGTAYDGAAQRDLSIAAYKKGLTYAPYDYTLWYNIGVTYENMKEPEKAFEAYKKALQYNPFHAGSLNRIGQLELDKGHTVTAMLSFYMSLVCAPNSRYMYSNVMHLDEISSVKLKVSNGPSSRKSDNFYDLELLIASKIALSVKFKNEAKIKDGIINQTQMVIDKLEYNPKDTGFFMQNYVPFFIAIRDKKCFTPFICQAFHGNSSNTLQSAYKKNEKKVIVFKKWVYEYWHKRRQTQSILVNGKSQPVTFYYNEGDRVRSMGEYKNPNTENAVRTGSWVYFYENGYKQAEGSYTDGKKEDEWKYYYYTGELKEIVNYKNGEFNGLYEEYSTNGQITTKTFFVGDKIQGSLEISNEVGNLLEEKNMVDNKLDGVTKTYNPDGSIDTKLQYKAGNLDGEQILYYTTTGTVLKKIIYKDNKLEGANIGYHPNGKVKKTGRYAADLYVGVWIEYYDNGQILDSGAYNNEGASFGKWVSYHKNGKLKQVTTYDAKGKKLGDVKEYDVDGTLSVSYVYADSKLTAYTFYDKKGTVVSSGKEKGGVLIYKAYYPDGKTLSAEGTFKNGLQEGEWKFYNANNYLESKNQYAKGELDGLCVNYYSTGVVQSEKKYKNGSGDGLYKSYYRNTQLEKMGYFVEDQKQGYWIGFYPNGKPEEEYYYVNNQKDRYMVEYSVTGLKKREEYYEYGFLKFVNHFDTLGKVANVNTFNRGTGEYKMIYSNGQNRLQYQMKNGLIEGLLTFKHFNGKIEETRTYTKGNLNGEVKKYDEDGKLVLVVYYKNDERDGLWKYYYPNQKIATTGTYKNGLKDSLWTDYFENGNKDNDEYFKLGDYDGLTTYYSPDLANTIIFVKTYKDDFVVSYTYPGADGKLVPAIPISNETGDYKAKYASGSKAIEYSIKGGDRNGPYTEYYSTGTVFKEATYVAGFEEGKATEYFLNGKVSKSENYFYGEKDGVCKEYYANGTLKSVEVYVYGELNGTCIYYDQTGKVTKKVFYRDGVIYQ